MHHMPLLSMPSSIHLRLHIRSILDVLPEIAHVATDLLVRFEGERDEWNEAAIIIVSTRLVSKEGR